MRRVIIAGTGVPGPVARIVYGPLARALGAEVVALPRLGLGHIEEACSALARRVVRTAEPLQIIGHSQGGFAALDLAYRCGDVIRTVVTLGTPFAGTSLAAYWTPLTAGRCMAPGSRYLATVASQWRDCYTAARVHNVVAADDSLVIPYSSGLLPKWDDGGQLSHHVLTGVGHLGLVTSPRAIGLVAGLVNA